jgi:hypothetical protein
MLSVSPMVWRKWRGGLEAFELLQAAAPASHRAEYSRAKQSKGTQRSAMVIGWGGLVCQGPGGTEFWGKLEDHRAPLTAKNDKS